MNMYNLILLLNEEFLVLINRGKFLIFKFLVVLLICKVIVVNKILIFWNIFLLEYLFLVCLMFMVKFIYIRCVERKKLVVF